MANGNGRLIHSGSEAVVSERSYYAFDARAMVGGIFVAVAIWIVLVGFSAAVTHTWPWPIALIVGLALLPIGVSGGIRRNA
jgi:Na+/citrate or Na+/malate symporter